MNTLIGYAKITRQVSLRLTSRETRPYQFIAFSNREFGVRRRVPQPEQVAAFKLKRFINLLRRAIEDVYATIVAVPITGPRQIVIY